MPCDSPKGGAFSCSRGFLYQASTLGTLLLPGKRRARHWGEGAAACSAREIVIDNLLVRIHFIIEVILVDRSRAMRI